MLRNITEERGSDCGDLHSSVFYTHMILTPVVLSLKFSTKIHSSRILGLYMPAFAGPSGRAVWGVGLRPLACWDCGFESHRGVLCVVRYRSLRRTDHASRGVVPNVMRRCLWSRNLKAEEDMARVEPQRHRKTHTHTHTHIYIYVWTNLSDVMKLTIFHWKLNLWISKL